MLSRLRGELEHDFGVSNEAELVAGDAFDGFRISFQVFNLEPELSNIFREFGVFCLDSIHLGFEGSQPRQSLWGQHQCWGTDGGYHEDQQRKDPLEEDGQLRHDARVPRNSGKSQVR